MKQFAQHNVLYLSLNHAWAVRVATGYYPNSNGGVHSFIMINDVLRLVLHFKLELSGHLNVTWTR